MILRTGLAELGRAARRALGAGAGSLVRDVRKVVKQVDERLGEIDDNADRMERDDIRVTRKPK